MYCSTFFVKFGYLAISHKVVIGTTMLLYHNKVICMRSSAILAIARLCMIRYFYRYNRQLSQPAMLLLTDDTRGGVTDSWAEEHQEYKIILLTIPVLCTHSLLPLAIFLLILLIFHPFIT